MVEPIAAAILNKLLLGGTSLNRTSSIHSLVRAVSTSRRKTLMPGFFTPQPRRATLKGKERAIDVSSSNVKECQEWLSCAEHHAVWCPRHCRFIMLQELDQDDCAYFRHRRSRPVGNPHARRKPTSITSRAFTTQRRHLSGRARARFRVTDSPIPTLPETLGDPRQLSQQQITLEFQKLINRASKDFDPDLTWEFYEALEASPTQHQKLTLADQLLHAGEQFYGTENEAKGRRSQLWAERASEVLEGLGPETVRWGNWINQLHARATAALGDFDKAVSYASKVSSRAGQNDSSNAWAKILSSVSHRQGAVAALDFIVANWALLKNLFSDKGSPLRQTADALVRRIEDPAQVMARRRDHVTHEERRIAGCVLIDVFAYIDARQGLAVYEELKRQAVTIPLGHKLALVRRLADTRAFGPAELLFNSIEDKEPRRDILSTGLYLQSRQALRESASHWYDELEAEGLAQPHDITNHLFAYARAGDVDGVLHQFNKHFPLGPDNKRLNSPQVPHYSPVILALSKRGLSEEIAKWLQDLSDNGLKPDVYTYTLVLQALALGDDLQGALAVLKNMQSEGIQPNVVAYTIVITLLAHRKDAFGAEAVFRRALQDDIVPDTKMMSALMNAHVEAGSWKGVIRVYDFLNSKRIRSRVRMSIDVYNTLLKAYVLAGAPFSVVSKVFQTLEDSKVKPDNRTFCLLIQSACDAGKIELASDLFWRMDALASARKERDLSVNIFALTILMAAYLRIGKKVKAKAVFDEMQSRGIDPTSVTFATILRAYGNERTVESMQIAEHFITELLAAPPEEQSWNIPRYGRVPAIQQIYSPVMQAYAKQAKLDDVERMFESMLKKGGAPSLGTLTMLLDACRRTFNVKGVLEVWPQILQLGLRYLNSLPADIKGEHRGFSLGSNILSAPLSIYIDALSAAGMHGEVAETWHEMRRLGFTYDSHNYNNLVVALVRAGQVERAFEVVDRVLLPNHNRAKHFVPTRNKSPASPLLFETAPETLNAQTEESEGQVDQVDSAESTAPINDQEDQEQPSESTATAPAEVSEDNAESEEDQTHDIPGRKIRHHSKDRRKAMKEAHKNLKYEDLFDDDFGEHDLARPLHVLHQLAPSWGLWRPHTTVLTILLQAHAQLERGEIIYPIPAPDAEPMEPLENEAQHARAILVNIYKEYPIATQVVLKHQSLEKRRLGWEDYSRIYEG